MTTDPRYATGHNGHRAMEDLAVAEDHQGSDARE